jgi:two-component system KDP operon response regulator KdpE
MNTNTSDEVHGTILLVDDDSSLRRVLRITLSGIGFTIVEASRGEEAVTLANVSRFDAVLLDVDLPGMGGLEACRSIRNAVMHLPILMLTAMNSEDDLVAALAAGADDYITKPFRMRELTARLRAAVRRRNARESDGSAPLRHGQLELDPVKYRVQKRGRPIHLSPKEFEILHFLMLRAGEPIPHAQLLRSVWGPGYGNELEYLRTYIRQLRKKIEDDPVNPNYILTESHVGYRFREQQPEVEL